jgi:hypothetical protein
MPSATLADDVKAGLSNRQAKFLEEIGSVFKKFEEEKNEGGIPFPEGGPPTTIVLSGRGVGTQTEGDTSAADTASPQEAARPRNFCWNGFVLILC